MAASGTISKTFHNGGYTLLGTWTESDVSTSGNTSDVTVVAKLRSNGSSYNINSSAAKPITITINGKEYGSTCTVGLSGGETITLFTAKAENIAHNSDGSKTISISISLNIAVTLSGTYYSSVTATGTAALTKIARKSTLTVADGTLGTAQTLKITEQDSTFKHKLIYECGDVSGYILGSSSAYSTSNSVSWTPPLTLASENTTGTSVTIEFTLYTYTSDGTSIGSNAYTKTFAIPTSVKPTVSLAVSDPTGFLAQFGKYVQGKSTINVVLTASGSYGSTIKSYKTTVDGKTYTSAEFTTEVISGNGTLAVNVTVTDSRGRTATASAEIEVYEYNKPKITDIKATRCTSNGTTNNSGEYLKVTFSSEVTALDNQNTVTVYLSYKKVTEESYSTPVELTAYADTYVITDGTSIFSASKSDRYDILLTITDALDSIDKKTKGNAESVFFSKLWRGLGAAYGKLAELEGVFDIGWKTRFYGGILHLVLEDGTDLDEVLTPNTYAGKDVASAEYSNCPVTSGRFTLEVITCGDAGEVLQRFTTCIKDSQAVYERIYYDDAWGDWVCNMENLFPIGSCYTTNTNTNPSSWLGGTWTLRGKKFASYSSANNDAFTIYSTNVSSASCYLTRYENVIDVRLSITTKVALADSTLLLGSLNFGYLGCSVLPKTCYPIASTDGGNGFVQCEVRYNTGEVVTLDVVTKTSGGTIAAGSSVILEYTFVLSSGYMLDSLCNQFIWERTA